MPPYDLIFMEPPPLWRISLPLKLVHQVAAEDGV